MPPRRPGNGKDTILICAWVYLKLAEVGKFVVVSPAGGLGIGDQIRGRIRSGSNLDLLSNLGHGPW